jgi:cobalt-zinc-cadmium efflux system outer membrane protein
MLWRSTSLLVPYFLASSLWGQAPDTRGGLEKLIEQAFEHNREILAAQQRVAEANGLFRQAGVRPAPTLEVNAASGAPLGTKGEDEYSAGYFLPVETAGKRAKRIRVAEGAVELAEAELAEQRRQLAYDITTRYIDAVASALKLDAINRIIDVNKESYRLVDTGVMRDDAAPLERQLLLVEMNRTDAQRAMAAGRLSTAQTDLQRTVATGGEAPNIQSSWSGLSAVSASSDELRTLAIERRPDLKIARLLASQAASEFALAEAQGKPDLTVSAQYPADIRNSKTRSVKPSPDPRCS